MNCLSPPFSVKMEVDPSSVTAGVLSENTAQSAEFYMHPLVVMSISEHFIRIASQKPPNSPPEAGEATAVIMAAIFT